jgi:DNA-binding MarR family transcriptional regulator
MQRKAVRVSTVEAHLGYWVRYVGFRVSHELRLRTQKFGVTAAEWIVLRALYEAAEMPSRLATGLGVTRSAISKLAKRLEAKELITRQKCSSDRRAQMLTLTVYGRVLVPTLAALADQTDVRNFGGMDPASRQTIRQVMKWIVRRDRLRFVPSDRERSFLDYRPCYWGSGPSDSG